MTILDFLSIIFISINSAAAVTHSLRFLHTAAAGIPAFPEFVTVVLVDGQPFSYYDSQLRRELPRQSWTLQAEEPDFWERRTNNSIVDEQKYSAPDSVNDDLVLRAGFQHPLGDFQSESPWPRSVNLSGRR
ncbi:Major histocompatibility complex class I-related gene protein [Oryzias melastigma]|uniref:Major histocompatibility complex class I-related gene protein n=1 Tax=Oryzias melastigma TaxID=30732 RepID=A0A834F9T6_ORYME|nr:Major histocompatibility complex class I-related gene protein [Oryzias melastigma]